jgi:hypothetical protein
MIKGNNAKHDLTKALDAARREYVLAIGTRHENAARRTYNALARAAREAYVDQMQRKGTS